ncbi:MAG: HAMP domain-containing sensor histidine kinase [Clostridiaceae bacterium]
MVTKLRKFSTNTATKITAFLLVVILITAAVAQMQYIAYKSISMERLFVSEYRDSTSFSRDFYNAFNQVKTAMEKGSAVSGDSGFYYYITDGSKVLSNAQNTDKSFFEQFDKGFYAFEKGVWLAGKNANAEPAYKYPVGGKYTLYLAFTNEFLDKKQTEWQEERNTLIPIVAGGASCAAAALILIIFLIAVTGRKSQDEKLHLSRLDNVYSDVMLGAYMPIGLFWLLAVGGVSNEVINGTSYQNKTLNGYQVASMIGVGIITSLVSTMCLLILLSLVRKIKGGRLIKHSLAYTVSFKIYDFFRSLFDGRMFSKYPLTKSLFYRQMVFIASSAAIIFFMAVFLLARIPLALLFPVFEVMIIYWYIKGNNRTFADINNGFSESFQEQMRAERTKIELVTNVSHDLKTPLTSIISYVDLLSREENMSETARDYVRILEEKSNRLKNIVSDLFDLAKSTSGDIALELERLDMKKLIEQTLGDMEDNILKSQLQMKIKLPDHPVFVKSDGKKLYRVFQNVIDNALKYSLEGTRVFLELEELDGKAVATIKNIAASEMDFTADEVLQRFNRGDKSRTTEGSGLGLSIAESFTKVCGGNFKLNIDGDLFKVTISFNLDRNIT